MRGRMMGMCFGTAALSVALAGCASGGSPSTAEPTAYGAPTATAAASEFLDAAKANDYRVMASLFGTADGPAEQRLGRTEVEQRMFVLASLLRHQSYAIRPGQLSAGEGQVRLLADLVGTRNGDVTVPMITASHRGRWFVERIETDRLTPP